MRLVVCSSQLWILRSWGMGGGVARLTSGPNYCSVKFETTFVLLQVQLTKVGAVKKTAKYTVLQPPPSSSSDLLLILSFAAVVVCSDSCK